MPFTLNGFGTTYYGKADQRPDGSYITTEWIAAAFVPVVPLQSLRLVPLQGKNVNVGIYNSQSYGILEKLPIQWSQVLRIWGFLAASACWLVTIFWLFFDKLDVTTHEYGALFAFGVFVFALVPPCLLVWWTRRSALRAKYGAPDQGQPPNVTTH